MPVAAEDVAHPARVSALRRTIHSSFLLGALGSVPLAVGVVLSRSHQGQLDIFERIGSFALGLAGMGVGITTQWRVPLGVVAALAGSILVMAVGSLALLLLEVGGDLGTRSLPVLGDMVKVLLPGLATILCSSSLSGALFGSFSRGLLRRARRGTSSIAARGRS